MLKPVLGTQLQLGNNLVQGLTFCPLLNEGCGSKVLDAKHSVVGTFRSGASWTSGKFGSAVYCDGTVNGIVDFGDYDCQLVNAISVSLWIKRGRNVSDEYVFGKYAAVSGGRGFIVYLQQTGSARITFNIGINSGDTLFGANGFDNSTNLFVVGEWHHLCWTRYLSNVHMYFDGIEGTLAGNSILTNDISNVSTALQIGNSSSATRDFMGGIDLPMVWNRALSANEVAQLYNETFERYQEEM